jgi:hypothetical protein
MKHDRLYVAAAIVLGAWCGLLLAWLIVEVLGR